MQPPTARDYVPLQVVDGVRGRSGAEQPALEALAKGVMRRSTPRAPAPWPPAMREPPRGEAAAGSCPNLRPAMGSARPCLSANG